eukprot:2456452-Heterocapsa_arctica.AAC.1
MLAPGAGLKFEDAPNGLAACSKVPLGGWMQILSSSAAMRATSAAISGRPASRATTARASSASSAP